jgi:hypothetical protein
MTPPAQSGSLNPFAPASTIDLRAPADAVTPVLPSGRSTVSTAIVEHRKLAVDQAGAVFLSQDWGKHWESVARQWTGRAIGVRVTTDTSNPKTPVQTFLLTSDSGAVWGSQDGKTWTAQ